MLDRCWLHGTTQDETRIGFSLSGTNNVALVNSYFSDFHCLAVSGSCIEAHAVSGGGGNNQDGPYKIEDNFLEASGQAILFGGAPATTTPTDITIRFNHVFKPWQWMKGNSPFQGGASGHPFIVRHALELKNAVRVLIEDNLIENVWGGFGESGLFGVVITANLSLYCRTDSLLSKPRDFTQKRGFFNSHSRLHSQPRPPVRVLEVIEQITYLLFLKRLDEQEIAKELKANREKSPCRNAGMEEVVGSIPTRSSKSPNQLQTSGNNV